MTDIESQPVPITVYPENVRSVSPVVFSEEGYIRGCNTVQSEEWCYEILSVMICMTADDHPKVYRHRYCNDPLCPLCFGKYIPRLAEGAAEMVKGYWGLNPDTRPYHLILSPPPGTRYKTMQDAFDEAYSMLEFLECRAAVVMYHPYRLRPAVTKALDEYRSRTGTKLKKWELAREDVLGLGTLGYYVYYSPHFHAVAFGHLMDSRDFESYTRWIYRKIRYMKDEKEIAQLVAYIQTHAAWEYGKQTVRYWNGISYSKLARKRISKERVKKRCEVCGDVLCECEYDEYEGKIGPVKKEFVLEWLYSYIYWKRGDPDPLPGISV